MPSSSTKKPCAVVVAESMQKCRDVLPASSDLVNHTPCPFGLNIYAWDERAPYHTFRLPLIYVSEAAARDRSQQKNPMNGTGVRPGWYAIAHPARFNVHASYVNPKHFGHPWEDALQITLEVDGQYTHKKMAYIQDEHKRSRQCRQNFVFDGFVVRRIASQSSLRQRRTVVRPFAFEKVSSSVEAGLHGTTDVGTITLKVAAGVLTFSAPSSGETNYDYPGKEVSEKAIAKEGSTMKVSNSLSSVTKISTVADYRVRNKRNLSEAQITVFIRERSWLRSRRLIDDNDHPVTYDAFQKLLKVDQPPVKRTRQVAEVVNVDQEPVKKRPKIKEQMVLHDDVDPIQPGEVIDLT